MSKIEREKSEKERKNKCVSKEVISNAKEKRKGSERLLLKKEKKRKEVNGIWYHFMKGRRLITFCLNGNRKKGDRKEGDRKEGDK